MSTITRGDPSNLKNVRAGVYHHYIRVDNPTSLIFLSGQLSRDAEGRLVGAGDMAEQTRQAIRCRPNRWPSRAGGSRPKSTGSSPPCGAA